MTSVFLFSLWFFLWICWGCSGCSSGGGGGSLGRGGVRQGLIHLANHVLQELLGGVVRRRERLWGPGWASGGGALSTFVDDGVGRLEMPTLTPPHWRKREIIY